MNIKDQPTTTTTTNIPTALEEGTMSTTPTPTWVTPYQAAQILNVILQEEDLPTIRPQMIYNYVKKGYLNSQDGKINIQDTSDKGFTTWVKKYVEKKKNQDTKVSAQDLRNLMNI